MEYKNLHTVTLEKLFGPIKNRIIKQDENIRIIHLDDKNGVSRTLGIVRFFNIENNFLGNSHQKIVAGAMLGKTLFDSDIDFDKEFIGTVRVKLPVWLKEDFKTEQNSSLANFSKISIYTDRKADDKFLYSELIEIVPPEFANVFGDKTKPLKKLSENVLSLFKAAKIEVSILENKS